MVFERLNITGRENPTKDVRRLHPVFLELDGLKIEITQPLLLSF